jgi:hypothetical protein
MARMLWPAQGRPLGSIVACKGQAYERVLRPFLLAALNIDPPEASGDLVRAVVRETMAAGGGACRPYLAPQGLSAAFVEPALAYLGGRGVTVRFGEELRRLVFGNGAVAAADFGQGEIALGSADGVILAVPAYTAAALLPKLRAPDEYRAIVNAHFRIVPPPGLASMTGVLNGVAEWIFAFDDRISVTVSGADRLLQHPRDELAEMIWSDVKRVANIGATLPPWQIVRERRATFAATPAQNAQRPAARTAWRNLVLAGDWTATGLPATIEGAVRSGNRAADLVMGQSR